MARNHMRMADQDPSRGRGTDHAHRCMGVTTPTRGTVHHQIGETGIDPRHLATGADVLQLTTGGDIGLCHLVTEADVIHPTTGDVKSLCHLVAEADVIHLVIGLCHLVTEADVIHLTTGGVIGLCLLFTEESDTIAQNHQNVVNDVGGPVHQDIGGDMAVQNRLNTGDTGIIDPNHHQN